MSRPERKIPKDPKENLKQLKSINEHMKGKKEHKEGILAQKLERVGKYKELLADFAEQHPNLNECSQEDLELAANREQILECTRVEVDNLKHEIDTLTGQLRWNENKQKQVEAVLEKAEKEPERLTYTMAAALRAAQAAGVVQEVEDEDDEEGVESFEAAE